MFKKFGALFRGKPHLIQGAGKLEEGHARKVEFGDPIGGNGVEVIVCRVDGALSALDARCPHEGGRITEGPLVDGKYAVCPLHNYWFDPATGEVQNAACKKAKAFKIREVDGNAEIWL